MISFIKKAATRALILISISITLTTTAHAYPTGASGGAWWLGGSSLTIKWQTIDINGLATIQLNYFESDQRLCFSGEVEGDYADGDVTGTAVYKLLGTDDPANSIKANTRGICYSHVSQTPKPLVDEFGDPVDVGPGGVATEYVYTVPSLEDLIDAGISLDTLLDGRLQVIAGTGTGYLTNCNVEKEEDIDTNFPLKPELDLAGICDFQVGIGFNDPIPPTFFPATVTTAGDPVEANVVLYSNEICIEYGTADLGLAPSYAINAKSAKLRACEALAIKGDWCSDLQNLGTPRCDTVNEHGQLTSGGFNVNAGDFLKQQPFDVVCVNDVSDLQGLSCEGVNLAACSDGNGLIEMPTTYESIANCGDNPISLSFSSSDGGGSDTLNVTSIMNFGSPGSPGDNSTPPCTSAAIVSTPSNNEANIWDFSSTTLFGICFVDVRNNDDILTLSQGPDVGRGGSGADTVNGEGGNDVLQGGDNADLLNGDDGDDLILGYECFGTNSDCSVVRNNGSDDDVLNGGNGNDILDGGRGNDTLTGGAGNDGFVLFGNVDNDVITDYTTDEDVIVDLTGSATVVPVKGSRKDNIPSICTIKAGGNDTVILEGIDAGPGGDCNSTYIEIVVPGDGYVLPAQFAAHPYSFQ